VTLIPVISIVQGGRQAMADRYTYVPYIGLFLMLGWGLPKLLSKLPYQKIIFGLSMAAALTPLGICAHRQTGFWKDSITLFSHAIKVTQNNYVAYNNLGNAYGRLGRWSEAVDAQQQAVKIRPDSARAYYNLGVVYNGLARWHEAIEAYRQAIRIKPNYSKAHNNLGYAYLAAGDKNSAMAEYNILKSLNPEMADNLLKEINK
jgi:tetratricopeptide (TPR) repeat protein